MHQGIHECTLLFLCRLRRVTLQAKSLRVHVRVTHEGLRPFACTFPDCKSSFAHKHLLVRHRRIHERNEQPSPNTSSEAVSESSSRTLVDELTGGDYEKYAEETGRVYTCPVSTQCAFRFRRLYDQKRHVETAHADFVMEPVN